MLNNNQIDSFSRESYYGASAVQLQWPGSEQAKSKKANAEKIFLKTAECLLIEKVITVTGMRGGENRVRGVVGGG